MSLYALRMLRQLDKELSVSPSEYLSPPIARYSIGVKSYVGTACVRSSRSVLRVQVIQLNAVQFLEAKMTRRRTIKRLIISTASNGRSAFRAQ
jgi:hypothetical protein